MSDTTFMPEVQDPLVPADVSFPGFQFLHVDIKAVTEGDLSFLSGDGFKAALTLMAKSWQETPAASLPDDDRKLAAHCEFGRGPAALPAWAAVKDEALSDFTLCSDGRWYSRTLAPKALEAWKGVAKRKSQTEAAREARSENRKAEQNASGSATTSVTEPVTFSITEDVTTSATGSRGDQIRSEETGLDGMRPEETVTEGTRSGASSGTGGAGGRLPRPAPRKGPALEAFNASNIHIPGPNMNRLAGQFPNITDIVGALNEINSDLSGVEESKRLAYAKIKLRDRNEEAGKVMEDMDLPF